MKLSKYLPAAAALLLLLPFSAYARSKDSGSLSLSSPLNIGSTQLEPGSYKVRWSGAADKVNVDILQRNKTVATSQGKLIELPKPAQNNSVETNSQTNQIQEIDFSGKRQALVILPVSS
jgi:hypothetical protein